MTKQLYIIEYDSAHWCGGTSHCVTWAHSAAEALQEAHEYMETSMRELFSDEYDEYYDEETETGAYDELCAYVVNWCELLTPEHEHWPYYTDPAQADFYPLIG